MPDAKGIVPCGGVGSSLARSRSGPRMQGSLVGRPAGPPPGRYHLALPAGRAGLGDDCFAPERPALARDVVYCGPRGHFVSLARRCRGTLDIMAALEAGPAWLDAFTASTFACLVVEGDIGWVALFAGVLPPCFRLLGGGAQAACGWQDGRAGGRGRKN